MSKIQIFSPETVAKTVSGKPYITMSRKSGLISISSAAIDKIGKFKHFVFSFIPEEKQGYIIAKPEGFEFRANKEGKGVALNHTALVKSFLEANNVPIDMPSYRFIIGAPLDEEDRLHEAGMVTIEKNLKLVFPLIKTLKTPN
jgi:hypothetical protein